MTDKKLPTVDIHGKEYVLVKDRILAFHELYDDGEIQTDITITGESVLAKAIVKVGTRTFTGHSEAVRGRSSGITGQSPVEVAETSAVGRALGMLGIGILESVASADEIRKAPQVDSDEQSYPAKKATTKQKDFIAKLYRERGEVKDNAFYSELSMSQAKQIIDELLKPSSKEPIIDEDGETVVAGEFGEPVSNDNLPF